MELDKLKAEIRSIFLIVRMISNWNKVVQSYVGKISIASGRSLSWIKPEFN